MKQSDTAPGAPQTIGFAKPDPRVCPKCGMGLKPRGKKLPGRYYCPNSEHPEGEAEYIITCEFYCNSTSFDPSALKVGLNKQGRN